MWGEQRDNIAIGTSGTSQSYRPSLSSEWPPLHQDLWREGCLPLPTPKSIQPSSRGCGQGQVQRTLFQLLDSHTVCPKMTYLWKHPFTAGLSGVTAERINSQWCKSPQEVDCSHLSTTCHTCFLHIFLFQTRQDLRNTVWLQPGCFPDRLLWIWEGKIIDHFIERVTSSIPYYYQRTYYRTFVRTKKLSTEKK